MNFSTKIFLPIIKRDIRVKPIINQYIFDLIKYITNNDEDGVQEYFEFIIKKIVVEQELLKNITNIEKFIILLNGKLLSSGNKIQLIGKNQVKTDILISGILKNIIDKITNINLTNNIKSENFEFDISIPKNLKIKNTDDIYKEVINYIKIEDDIILFSSLTDEEKEVIMNNIPVIITGDILTNILKIKEKLNNVFIINGNEKMGLEPISLNPFDNTLFYFLKSLFSDDLKSFYELQFILINKILMTYDHFLQITPNDCKIFINLYNEDIQKQQEQQKNSQATSTSMPSLPSMPSMPKFK